MAFTNFKNPDHSSVGKEVIEDHATSPCWSRLLRVMVSGLIAEG